MNARESVLSFLENQQKTGTRFCLTTLNQGCRKGHGVWFVAYSCIQLLLHLGIDHQRRFPSRVFIRNRFFCISGNNIFNLRSFCSIIAIYTVSRYSYLYTETNCSLKAQLMKETRELAYGIPSLGFQVINLSMIWVTSSFHDMKT